MRARETYEGRPLDELPVNEVDWSHRGDHIRTRTKRYPDRPEEFDVEPEWATEAALEVLNHPMDKYLQYTLDETMNTLDRFTKQAKE